MNKFNILSSSQHIQPLTNIIDLLEQHVLGDKLHEMVSQPQVRAHLRQRHLLGVLARHGVEEYISQKAVVTARSQHNKERDVFVLRGYEHQPLGLATVDPAVMLRALRYEMPPILARGRLSNPIPVRGPEVTAWVDPEGAPEAGNVLATAYKVLSDPAGPAHMMFERFAELHPISMADDDGTIRAFTIEPLASGPWMRDVLEAADFSCFGEGNYDDGESRRSPVPRSRYYRASPSVPTT